MPQRVCPDRIWKVFPLKTYRQSGILVPKRVQVTPKSASSYPTINPPEGTHGPQNVGHIFFIFF